MQVDGMLTHFRHPNQSLRKPAFDHLANFPNLAKKLSLYSELIYFIFAAQPTQQRIRRILLD